MSSVAVLARDPAKIGQDVIDAMVVAIFGEYDRDDDEALKAQEDDVRKVLSSLLEQGFDVVKSHPGGWLDH